MKDFWKEESIETVKKINKKKLVITVIMAIIVVAIIIIVGLYLSNKQIRG